VSGGWIQLAKELRVAGEEETLVVPTRTVKGIEDDPEDDLFLEIALEAEAEYIVSGDPHLTDLGAFRDIEIVSPTAFLEQSSEPV